MKRATRHASGVGCMCLGKGPVYAVGDTAASLTICWATGSSCLTFCFFLGFVPASGLASCFTACFGDLLTGPGLPVETSSSFLTCITDASGLSLLRLLFRKLLVLGWVLSPFMASNAAPRRKELTARMMR